MIKPTRMRRIAVIFMMAAGLLPFSLILLGLAQQGHFEFLLHLLGGFGFFLHRNLPAISMNSATWIPGVSAFLLVLVVGHRFLKRWATYRGHAWSFTNTFCAAMLLPVLFGIAFIVPGALLQVDLLRQSPWFQPQRHHGAILKMALRNYAQAAFYLAEESPGKRFPHSLEAIEEADLMDVEAFVPFGDSYLPMEPFIYLGADQTLSSDPSLPLCISPPYPQNGVTFRQLITLAGEFVEIHDEEVDSWIERVYPRAKDKTHAASKHGKP